MLKHITFLICFAGLFCNTTLGQCFTDSIRFSLSVNVGASLPFSNFGSHISSGEKIGLVSAVTNNTGFANPGPHAALSFNGYLDDHVALVLYASFNMHSVNTAAYANSIQYYENANPSTTSSGNYLLEQVMAGACFFVGNSKTEGHFVLMFGGLFANCPTLTTTFSATSVQPAGSFTTSNDGTGSGINFYTGMGIKRLIAKKLAIGFDAGFSISPLHYKNFNYTETLQGSPPATNNISDKANMTVGLATFTFSLSYYLGHRHPDGVKSNDEFPVHYGEPPPHFHDH